MQKNKKQMSYQGTETFRFGFEVRNEVKKPETKFLFIQKTLHHSF